MPICDASISGDDVTCYATKLAMSSRCDCQAYGADSLQYCTMQDPKSKYQGKLWSSPALAVEFDIMHGTISRIVFLVQVHSKTQGDHQVTGTNLTTVNWIG